MTPQSPRSSIFIATIREKRLGLGYSQEYMATKLDIGQNAYSKLELGKSALTVDRLVGICDLLDIDIADLIKNSSVPRANYRQQDFGK